METIIFEWLIEYNCDTIKNIVSHNKKRYPNSFEINISEDVEDFVHDKLLKEVENIHFNAIVRKMTYYCFDRINWLEIAGLLLAYFDVDSSYNKAKLLKEKQKLSQLMVEKNKAKEEGDHVRELQLIEKIIEQTDIVNALLS